MFTWSISVGPVPVSQFDGAADRAAAEVLDSADRATREQVLTAIQAVAAIVEAGVLGGERVGATISGSAMPDHQRDDASGPAQLHVSMAFYDSVDRAENAAQDSELANLALLGVPAGPPPAGAEVWDI